MAYLRFEERRRRIIDAAVEVLAAEGLQGLTTRRIAQRAKAPLGALHYCFRDKEEIISLVSERGVAKLQEIFDDLPAGMGIEETIRECIAAFWRWYRENIGLQLALMELGLWRIRRGGTPAEVYAMWDPFGRDLLVKRLKNAVKREGVEPAIAIEDIVRFILHRFDGMAYEYGASRDEAACERQTQMLADAMVALALPARRIGSEARPAETSRGSKRPKATHARSGTPATGKPRRRVRSS